MLATLALFLLPVLTPQQADSPWTELFPGGEIGEWTVVGGDGKYVFEEEDGVPVLYGYGATGQNTFLVSPREYSDFVLEIDVKIEAGGNSGVQFRSHINDKGRLYGYQAEIDPSERAWSAGIYDEGRRGWIDDLKDNDAARAAFRVGEWNSYTIAAQGGLLKTWVNGVKAADHYDEADASGVIALQVHSGGKTHVRWRNARIRELPRMWKQAAQISGEFFGDRAAVEKQGTPGTISVFGHRATPLLLDGEAELPIAAVAWYGAGSVVAVTHNGYASEDSAFYPHALHWLETTSRGTTDDRPVQRGDAPRVLRWSGAGPSAKELASADILLMTGNGPLTPERAFEVREWVARGGALFAALCPWGFEQVNARRGWDLKSGLAENQILAPMGMVFAGGYAEAKDGKFPVTPDALAMAHAAVALACLPLASGDPPSMVPVEHALRSVPSGAAPAFESLFGAIIGPVLEDRAPHPVRPLKNDSPYARLAIIAASQSWQELAPEDIQPAAGSEAFPGAVDPSAPRMSASRSFEDAGGGGWHSTDAYLAAGEVLSVRVVSGDAEGWSIRVGCHKDKLWHKDKWLRWPEITVEQALVDGLELATPWGGMVYLVAKPGAQPVQLEIGGVVSAAIWREGMSAGAWRKRLATADAPWVELVGKHLILSVPLTAAQTLDDPTPLMAFWDSVMEAHCKLGSEPLPKRPERFVADAQISAGYMHAGYPIMTWLDVVDVPADGSPPVMLDYATLSSKGNWGMFHELGHNRQDRMWTFGGTGEVTCNWFSLHAGDLLCGIEPWTNPWLQNQKMKGVAYLDAGADYQVWRSNPGIALICYAQLQKEFGWQPYYDTTAWYRGLPSGQRPGNDAEKRDLWVKRMSLATGHDLRPFHRKWGWPLGDALMNDKELAELPAWMPDFDELRLD